MPTSYPLSADYLSDTNDARSQTQYYSLSQNGKTMNSYADAYNSNHDAETSTHESCTGDCSIINCASCSGSIYCSEPCSNIELCSSGYCDDIACKYKPLPSDTEHRTPLAGLPDLYPTIEGVPIFEDFENETMHCGWLLPDHQCNVSVPTRNDLSQHVYQQHIEPQATLTCEWDHCDDQIDIQNMSEHLWHDHSPSPDIQPHTYVCLWQNCHQAFSSSEQLEAHMTSHCTVGCHWAGCEVAKKSPTELRTHIDEEHITGDPHQALQNLPSLTYCSTDLYNSFSASPSVGGQDALNSSATSPVETEQHAHPIRGVVCLWITGASSGEVCGATHSDENDLQAHTEAFHISGPQGARYTPFNFVCKWRDCERNGKPFLDREKLKRHMHSHSGCESQSSFQERKLPLTLI